MPRPRQQRKVQVPPRLKGLMPIGNYRDFTEQVMLGIEEYESIRLLDYEGLSQEEAATLMEVSRPTLTRVYESARKKVARTLTEALPLMIEGGQVTYNENWFRCEGCGSWFNSYHPDEVNSCPLCKNSQIIILNHKES